MNEWTPGSYGQLKQVDVSHSTLTSNSNKNSSKKTNHESKEEALYSKPTKLKRIVVALKDIGHGKSSHEIKKCKKWKSHSDFGAFSKKRKVDICEVWVQSQSEEISSSTVNSKNLENEVKKRGNHLDFTRGPSKECLFDENKSSVNNHQKMSKISYFEDLKLNDLITPESVPLNSISLDFQGDNSKLIEGITFYDPASAHQGIPLNTGLVDDAFSKLQNLVLQNVDSDLGCAYINNYPTFNQMSQINCDAYRLEVHSDYKYSIVADGCGWGNRSREAAQRVVAGVVHYLHQSIAERKVPLETAEDLGAILVKSFAAAHAFIFDSKKPLEVLGTATANLCVVFKANDGQKYLMTLGVGDCKTLVVTRNSNGQLTVADLFDSRHARNDAKDPGGRLGPYEGEINSAPDLRNLSLSCIRLSNEEEHSVFNMSDGVHDNFNPILQGIRPCAIDPSFYPDQNWEDLESNDYAYLNRVYQNDLFLQKIREAEEGGNQSLDALCAYIVNYCHELTASGRIFMDLNPFKNEPGDKLINPGKMDHCSITAFKA